jgi:hypothetical protein
VHAILGSFASKSAAQPNPANPAYRSLPAGPEAARSEKRKAKDEILKGASAFSPAVREYYIAYLLPDMTNATTPELNNSARAEILIDILNAEKGAEATHTQYSDMLIELARGLTGGPFHPSAGINAIHVISRLNKSKPKGSAAPEPNTKVTLLLMELATRGANDGLQASALSGLDRHIELASGGWNDDVRSRIAQPLMAALQQPRPPKRSVRSDAWMKGRYMEILTKFKHPGEGEVNKLAYGLLADTKTDPLLVEKALLVVGTYAPGEGLDPDIVKNSLINSAKLTRTRLLDWQKQLRDSASLTVFASTSSLSTDSADRASVMNENPDDTDGGEADGAKKNERKKRANLFAAQSSDVKFFRRMLHESLELIRHGFTGVRWGAIPDPAKSGMSMLLTGAEQVQIMRDILRSLKDLQDSINLPSITDRSALDSNTSPKIEKAVKDINDLLMSLGYEPPVIDAPPAPVNPDGSSEN